ncbi:MAG TPA: hypothetical protein VFQ80_14870, partial [Thermomicrobiales bacterium]|nr:hypothetical protein [Thermomicrobiales bacterium]
PTSVPHRLFDRIHELRFDAGQMASGPAVAAVDQHETPGRIRCTQRRPGVSCGTHHLVQCVSSQSARCAAQEKAAGGKAPAASILRRRGQVRTDDGWGIQTRTDHLALDSDAHRTLASSPLAASTSMGATRRRRESPPRRLRACPAQWPRRPGLARFQPSCGALMSATAADAFDRCLRRVFLNPQPTGDRRPPTVEQPSIDRRADQERDRAIARLEDEVAFLQAELEARTEENRRKDHLIAG